MKQLTLVALVAVLLPALAFAGSIEMSVKDQAPGEEKKVADTDTDTYGNGLAAAQRYLDVVPMKNMMRDIINEYTKNLPGRNLKEFPKNRIAEPIPLHPEVKAMLETMPRQHAYRQVQTIRLPLQGEALRIEPAERDLEEGLQGVGDFRNEPLPRDSAFAGKSSS